MSEILKKAKAHYRAQLDQDKRIVEIPEWDAKVYVGPANLATKDKIHRFIAIGSLEALVEIMILRAKDSEGLPYFSIGDREALLKMVDPDVLARAAMEINADLNLSVESEDSEITQIVKN